VTESEFSLDEAIHSTVHQRAELVRKTLRRSVRPIVVSEGGERPALVGSATPLQVAGAKYVATAAHVVDQADQVQHGAIHVLGRPGAGAVPARGKIVLTKAPPTGRGRTKST
jgi:hypothetical protein